MFPGIYDETTFRTKPCFVQGARVTSFHDPINNGWGTILGKNLSIVNCAVRDSSVYWIQFKRIYEPHIRMLLNQLPDGP